MIVTPCVNEAEKIDQLVRYCMPTYIPLPRTYCDHKVYRECVFSCLLHFYIVLLHSLYVTSLRVVSVSSVARLPPSLNSHPFPEITPLLSPNSWTSAPDVSRSDIHTSCRILRQVQNLVFPIVSECGPGSFLLDNRRRLKGVWGLVFWCGEEEGGHASDVGLVEAGRVG